MWGMSPGRDGRSSRRPSALEASVAPDWAEANANVRFPALKRWAIVECPWRDKEADRSLWLDGLVHTAKCVSHSEVIAESFLN